MSDPTSFATRSRRAPGKLCIGSLGVNEVLMTIVVHAAAFFELSGEDAVDPDAALKQLEWIHWELERLDPDAKQALIAFVRAEAETTDDPRYRAFLLEFPTALGLLDEK
jgi:hypothetical protein